MSKKRILLFRCLAIGALLLLAALLLVIGRGHTVYFDNKPLEGESLVCPYKVDVLIKGENAAKLYEGERGMTTWMGQNLKLSLKVMDTKGGDSRTLDLKIKLPYNMDGIVLNLPALLADLPQEVYLTQFVPVVAEEPVEEETIADEFGDMGDF